MTPSRFGQILRFYVKTGIIASLCKRNFGDILRLSDIKDRLVNGRTIYNSDREYVEKKFKEPQANSTKKLDIQEEKVVPSKISDEKERISVDMPSNTYKPDIRIQDKPEHVNKSNRMSGKSTTGFVISIITMIIGFIMLPFSLLFIADAIFRPQSFGIGFTLGLFGTVFFFTGLIVAIKIRSK